VGSKSSQAQRDRAAEVVGFHSIADFIDPAQIDERRQTIDAMRTALEPVDAETAAEVPWTATRKDGQQRQFKIVNWLTQEGMPATGCAATGAYRLVSRNVRCRAIRHSAVCLRSASNCYGSGCSILPAFRRNNNSAC